MTGRAHGKYRMKAPKTRAWGKTGMRKVMTQIIRSKKEKLRERQRQKELLKKELQRGEI